MACRLYWNCESREFPSVWPADLCQSLPHLYLSHSYSQGTKVEENWEKAVRAEGDYPGGRGEGKRENEANAKGGMRRRRTAERKEREKTLLASTATEAGLPLFLVSTHPIYKIALLGRPPPPLSLSSGDFISDLPKAEYLAGNQVPWPRVCPFSARLTLATIYYFRSSSGAHSNHDFRNSFLPWTSIDVKKSVDDDYTIS